MLTQLGAEGQAAVQHDGPTFVQNFQAFTVFITTLSQLSKRLGEIWWECSDVVTFND